MLYAAFVFWLFLILCMGVGVYRLWAQLVRPMWVNWALLPGTVLSEIAYIFGCLIAGGEVQRAKLMGDPLKSKSGGEGGSKNKAKLSPMGCLVANLAAIAACAAAIMAAQIILGGPVLDRFIRTWLGSGELPAALPVTWPAFWGILDHLVQLQRQTCEALVGLEWSQWQVVLFVYVSMALAVRLVPMRATARATLAAAMVIAGLVALAATLSPDSAGLIQKAWPLLTYVWTGLLTLLLASLLVRAIVAVIRALWGTSHA